jgi:hypothetical protein
MSNNNNFFDNSPLSEMGNRQATNSLFGTGSQFYTGNCNPFTADFYEGAVNQDALRFYLHQKDANKIFDWRSFLTDAAYSDQFSTLPERSSTRVAPFITEETGLPTFQGVRLNKNPCHILYTPDFGIQINIAQKRFRLYSHFFYQTTKVNGNLTMTDSLIDDTYTNVKVANSEEHIDQYKAVELWTYHVELYLGFMRAAGYKNMNVILLNEIQRVLPDLANQTPDTIEWFYRLMSDSILQQLPKEILWRDLKKLLQYDHSSWIADNSNTMLKVMRGIFQQEGGYDYLYERFESEATFVKSLYYSLNGQTPSFGPDGSTQLLDNHTIFASMLHIMTMEVYHNRKQTFKPKATFVIDDNFRVDSDAIDDNTPPGQFKFAQQRKEVQQIIIEGRVEHQEISWETVPDSTINLAPLDIVQLTIERKGRPPQTIFCPAIYLKDIAYVAEWERIDRVARAGFNILAIVGGVAVLATTGNPLIAILALTDIGLAGIDLLVQAVEERLQETPSGRSFLAFWEQMYQVGGIVVAIGSFPSLVKSLLQTGTAALRLATGKTRDFIKAVLISTCIQQQEVGQVFVKADIGAAALHKGFPISNVSRRALDRLEEAEVLLVRLEDVTGTPSYMAVYKGEVLTPAGSAKEWRETMKKALNKSGEKLKQELEEIRIDAVTKNFSGMKLTQLQFDEWADFIRRRGANVRFTDESAAIIEYFRVNNTGAGFQAETIPPTIWVIRGDVTDLKMFHESMHFEDYLRRGRENYLRGEARRNVEVEGLAARAQISKRDQLISTYIKEKFVYDRILEEQIKWQKKFGYGRFTTDEISFSATYMRGFEQDCIDAGIDISKIKIKPYKL